MPAMLRINGAARLLACTAVLLAAMVALASAGVLNGVPFTFKHASKALSGFADGEHVRADNYVRAGPVYSAEEARLIVAWQQKGDDGTVYQDMAYGLGEVELLPREDDVLTFTKVDYFWDKNGQLLDDDGLPGIKDTFADTYVRDDRADELNDMLCIPGACYVLFESSSNFTGIYNGPFLYDGEDEFSNDKLMLVRSFNGGGYYDDLTRVSDIYRAKKGTLVYNRETRELLVAYTARDEKYMYYRVVDTTALGAMELGAETPLWASSPSSNDKGGVHTPHCGYVIARVAGYKGYLSTKQTYSLLSPWVDSGCQLAVNWDPLLFPAAADSESMCTDDVEGSIEYIELQADDYSGVLVMAFLYDRAMSGVWQVAVQASHDCGATWNVTTFDSSDIDDATISDYHTAKLSVNQAGVWMLVFNTDRQFNGTWAGDTNNVFSVSEDGGITWSYPHGVSAPRDNDDTPPGVTAYGYEFAVSAGTKKDLDFESNSNTYLYTYQHEYVRPTVFDVCPAYKLGSGCLVSVPIEPTVLATCEMYSGTSDRCCVTDSSVADFFNTLPLVVQEASCGQNLLRLACHMWCSPDQASFALEATPTRVEVFVDPGYLADLLESCYYYKDIAAWSEMNSDSFTSYNTFLGDALSAWDTGYFMAMFYSSGDDGVGAPPTIERGLCHAAEDWTDVEPGFTEMDDSPMRNGRYDLFHPYDEINGQIGVTATIGVTTTGGTGTTTGGTGTTTGGSSGTTTGSGTGTPYKFVLCDAEAYSYNEVNLLGCTNITVGDLLINTAPGAEFTFGSLIEVAGDIVFTGSAYTLEATADFLALEYIGGSLVLNDTLNLGRLNLYELRTVATNVVVDHNSAFSILHAPKLTEVGGDIRLVENRELDEVRFTTLETIGGGMRLKGLQRLGTSSDLQFAPSLHSIGTDFVFRENAAAINITLPMLKNVQSIMITDCSAVDSVSLGKGLVEVTDLEIARLDMLRSVRAPELSIAESVKFEDVSKMDKLNLNSLKRVRGELVLRNAGLVDVGKDQFFSMKRAGSVVYNNNGATLTYGLGASNITTSMEIRNNNQLTKVDLQRLSVLGGNCTIEDNPLLQDLIWVHQAFTDFGGDLRLADIGLPITAALGKSLPTNVRVAGNVFFKNVLVDENDNGWLESFESIGGSLSLNGVDETFMRGLLAQTVTRRRDVDAAELPISVGDSLDMRNSVGDFVDFEPCFPTEELGELAFNVNGDVRVSDNDAMRSPHWLSCMWWTGELYLIDNGALYCDHAAMDACWTWSGAFDDENIECSEPDPEPGVVPFVDYCTGSGTTGTATTGAAAGTTSGAGAATTGSAGTGATTGGDGTSGGGGATTGDDGGKTDGDSGDPAGQSSGGAMLGLYAGVGAAGACILCCAVAAVMKRRHNKDEQSGGRKMKRRDNGAQRDDGIDVEIEMGLYDSVDLSEASGSSLAGARRGSMIVSGRARSESSSGHESFYSNYTNLSSVRTMLSEGAQELKFAELTVGEEIGKGYFGCVYKGKWRGANVAVKQLIKEKMNLASVDDFRNEANIMASAGNHPNVVALLGMCCAPDEPLCLVTEFLGGGSLEGYITDKAHNVTLTNVLQWARQIAAGMQHLHTMNIVHRDLAARNVLLTTDLRCKIADMGMSRLSNDLDQGNYSMAEAGPIMWMPPESLSKGKYSTKTDVWSFGIVCMECLKRGRPYDAMPNTQVVVHVAGGGKPDFPAYNVPEAIKKLVYSCLQFDAIKRPTMEELVNIIDRLLADQ